MRTLVVSAADESFMPLLRGLLGSLAPAAQTREFALACLDLGLSPASRAWLSEREVEVRDAGWDLPVAPQQRDAQPTLRALTVRPFLRDYFPGYDIYIWMDADTWLQDAFALDWLRRGAHQAGLAAVPEADRAYRFHPGIQVWRVQRLQSCHGAPAAQRLGWETYVNAGVFALRADAPHWMLWARHFAAGIAASGSRVVCDQSALNHMLWSERPPIAPLPALCNWLCHLAMPLRDPATGSFHEPFLPHQRLGILHLTSTTKDLRLPASGGGSFDLRFPGEPAGPASQDAATPRMP